MELWIRSQDKRHLIKAYYVSIMENNIINVASSGWDYDVAKYKSKERALEVLDEIQQRLIDIQSTQYLDISEIINFPRNIDCVYEMPEE